MKPARAEPLALQYQHDADDPGHDHRRHHDVVEQSIFHGLECFQQLRAGLRHGVINEQARQIEHARHPGYDSDDMQGFEPEVHGNHPRTRLSMRSTLAIGVSGKMPWPRLKISGPSPSSFTTSSTS